MRTKSTIWARESIPGAVLKFAFLTVLYSWNDPSTRARAEFETGWIARSAGAIESLPPHLLS